MSLKDALVAGLETVPDCEAVCYVDMSSGLVLGSHGRSRKPQEFYDRMGAFATRVLTNAALSNLAETHGGGTDGCVVIFGARNTHVFVKSKTFNDHALCYMCATTAEPDALTIGVIENRETVANAF